MSNLPTSPAENRVVKVISTVSLQPKILNLPNGATWGDVLSSMSSSEIPPNYRAVVRETKQDLVEPDAVLPSGEINIWLTPTMVKSGQGESPSTYTEIRPLMNDFEESLNDSFDIVIKEICKIIERDTDPDVKHAEDEDDDIYIYTGNGTDTEKSIYSLSKRLFELGLHLMFVNTRLKENAYLYSLLDDIEDVNELEQVPSPAFSDIKAELEKNGVDPNAAQEILEAFEFFKKTGTI